MADAATLELRRLRESLADCPVIDRGGYPYFVHPITDGVPRLVPAVLAEVVDGLKALLPEDVDLLVAPEAMGIPLAASLGSATGLPAVVARKRPYGLDGEVPAQQKTGYGEAVLHLNDVHEGERVVVVDDVVSTGGTLRALSRALADVGARLVKAVVAINKDIDLSALTQEIGCPVEALVRIRVTEDGVEVVDE